MRYRNRGFRDTHHNKCSHVSNNTIASQYTRSLGKKGCVSSPCCHFATSATPLEAPDSLYQYKGI
jgi:hypothetical protein